MTRDSTKSKNKSNVDTIKAMESSYSAMRAGLQLTLDNRNLAITWLHKKRKSSAGDVREFQIALLGFIDLLEISRNQG